MGDDVVVVGTSKEALNGKRGMVNEWDGQSRYRIAMHTGATVGLKAVNLRRPSEDEVEAYGRTARRSPTATAAVRIEELAELVRRGLPSPSAQSSAHHALTSCLTRGAGCTARHADRARGCATSHRAATST